MVKVFTDSTADLSEELLKKYDIGMIPLHISLGDKEYLDRIEISPEMIYEWVDQKKDMPKTSAASFQDVETAFRSVLDRGDEIIVFPISSQMSTTINVMRMVAEGLHAQECISIVDSQNLSTGIGLVAIEAAIMAKEGKAREEIVAKVEQLIPRVKASFVVDTLTYLHRGGRCNSVEAMAGGMLKLHPKIVVENGSMDADKKYRGKMDAVIRHYVEDMGMELQKALPSRVFITHSGCPQQSVTMVKEILQSMNHFHEVLITRAGGVISSHCGPGTLGVLFIAGE